jgi:isopentenyl-diphosphate delta-isomerase
MEHVILVDEHDKAIGQEEKMKAHEEGSLHRAFSIFVFNAKGEMLLQQRAKTKYHSGGLWTNACCGHPRPGEETAQAAHRRLQEEMGFDCPLQEMFAFTYQVDFDNGLKEHEYDHVFVGMFEGNVSPNPQEADDNSWVPLEKLEEDVATSPERYTYWFREALSKFAELG